MGAPGSETQRLLESNIPHSSDDPESLVTTPEPLLKSYQIGVWEVFTLVQSGRNSFTNKISSISSLLTYYISTYHLVLRLFKDVYSIAPRQCIVYLLSQCTQSIESGMTLYLNSRILVLISNHLAGQDVATPLIIRILAARTLIPLLFKLISEVCARNDRLLADRIKFFFMEKSMHIALLLDITTAEDPDVKSKLATRNQSLQSDSPVWRLFAGIIRTVTAFSRSVSQVVLAFILIRQHGSASLFFILCIIQLIARAGGANFWRSSHVVLCVNTAYERLAALHRFTYADRYRVDRLSDGVAEYIERDFKKNREELGDVSTEYVVDAWTRKQRYLLLHTFQALMGDFPIIYFSWRIISSKGFTFSSLTIYQQATSSVQSAIFSLVDASRNLGTNLLELKKTYAQFEIKNQMKDGDVSYPRLDNASEDSKSGMELEFRNVTFKYPGTTKAVLKDLSFKIKPGQMVVIVGVNGSGKSSTIKLFNRLYDPSEGEILIDGLPLSSYKLKDIRRAMAILRQDHGVYPLSLRLNIALGCPDQEMPNDGEIQEALEQGGAADFVEKLPNKVDTVLNPVDLSFCYFHGESVKGMMEMLKERQKVTDVSGGESQRLAASRVFMRLNNGGVRFLAVDEPTSAMDPEGELVLFNRLREQRGKKTLVFITHRFGHLTKYADQILVMKEGRLVESGTHKQLIDKDGEYKKLHDVQAQAFLPATDKLVDI